MLVVPVERADWQSALHLATIVLAGAVCQIHETWQIVERLELYLSTL